MRATGNHIFGKQIGDELCQFWGSVEDDEFQRLTANGLPPGWVAWHFAPGEDATNSERVRSVRRRPYIVESMGEIFAFHHSDAPIVESPWPTVDPRRLLAATE